MQGLIVIGFMLIITMFSYMEIERNDGFKKVQLENFKDNIVAANILQYNDILTQYTLNNYQSLHENDYRNYNHIDRVVAIDYKAQNLSTYSQKNLQRFLNFTSVVFNYGGGKLSADNVSQIASLYVVNSFSAYTDAANMYKSTNLDPVMGSLASFYATHLYQGENVSWVIPILVKQDGACNAITFYNQIPNDYGGLKQESHLRNLFKLWCTELEGYGYRVEKYAYIAPVIPTGA